MGSSGSEGMVEEATKDDGGDANWKGLGKVVGK